MRTVDEELDLALLLLRKRIKERGFTQAEVEMARGWSRGYLSQLLTKRRNLHLKHVLQILEVLGVYRGEFFQDVFDTQEGETR